MSLCIAPSKPFHVVVCVRISSLLKAEKYPVVWLDPVVLTHSPVRGHPGDLHLSALVNDAAVNVGVQPLTVEGGR